MTARTVINKIPLPGKMKELRTILNAMDLHSLNKEVRKELQMRVAIVGSVNTGKSTLLNYLVGKSVSAVSAIPGTTKTNIRRAVGPFELVDTPGFGDPTQPTRADYAREAIQSADVNLLLLDATAGVRQVDRDLYAELKSKQRPLVTALNKMDLIQPREADAVLSTVETALGCSVIPISARSGFNVSEYLIPRLIDEQPGLAVALGVAVEVDVALGLAVLVEVWVGLAVKVGVAVLLKVAVDVAVLVWLKVEVALFVLEGVMVLLNVGD